MRRVVLFGIAVFLEGCGNDTVDSKAAEGSIRAALAGLEPDDEAKKRWKILSETESTKFIASWSYLVKDICFENEAAFQKCQRNTLIMKDVDWELAQNKPTNLVNAFTEGLRLFFSDPKKPLTEEVEALRIEAKKSFLDKQKTEADLKYAQTELERWKRTVLQTGDIHLVIKAMEATDADCIKILKDSGERAVKKIIKKLLKDEKHGFDKVKGLTAYAPIFTGKSFADMSNPQELQKTVDAIYKQLIQ